MLNHNRNAARFTAPEEFYVLYRGERVDAIELSETGMRLPDPEARFVADETYDFALVIHDGQNGDGWELQANCVWARDAQAGFRFRADAHFRRTLFERLLLLRHRGRTKVISGTEF